LTVMLAPQRVGRDRERWTAQAMTQTARERG
jgi:hypothetical protein